MNILSNRIVDLVWKGIIGRWIILTVFLLLFAGAQNISAERKPRIVGGNDVDPPFQYTWMAALIQNKAPVNADLWYYFFCGGTLIKPDLVVTAAHCFYDDTGTQSKSAKDVDVLVGAHNLSNNYENICDIGGCLRQRIEVSELKIHEKYNPSTFENDIALLKLKSPAQRLPVATLISKASLKNPGTTATAIGWGATNADATERPEILQEVDLQVVSKTTCEGWWGEGGIKDTMLCAGYALGERDACSGDSGGPLVAPNTSQNDRWELIGIVSFGPSLCAQPGGQYGVYTDVYDYLDWIEPPSLTGAGVQLLLLDD